MIIGNIVTHQPIEFEKEFKVSTTIEDIIPNLPTIIIGWDTTKDIITEASILHKQIKENLCWTFTPKERKVEYEEDIIRFKNLCYSNIGNHLNYVYIDPIHDKKSKIKKIINKINSFNKSISYISDNNMLYIYNENIVFGVDLNIMELIGIKKQKIINKINQLTDSLLIRNQVFNKCKSIITKTNKNNKILPYIYRYGECSEDNNPIFVCP